MTIAVESRAAGRQGGAVAESLHPYLQVGSREEERDREVHRLLKPQSLLQVTRLLILPKGFYQLETKYANI